MHAEGVGPTHNRSIRSQFWGVNPYLWYNMPTYGTYCVLLDTYHYTVILQESVAGSQSLLCIKQRDARQQTTEIRYLIQEVNGDS
jgi:hypothetical protein